MCNQDDVENDANPIIETNDDFPWNLGLADTHCHPLEYPVSLSSQRLSKAKTQTFAVLATRLEDQPILHEIALQHQKDDKNARVIPGFGWHPWFSNLLYDDLNDDSQDKELSEEQIVKHFSQVLTPPAPTPFSRLLPKPTRLSSALSQLRTHLKAHPLGILGEVGLDKAFRVPEPWPDGVGPSQPPYAQPRPHLQGTDYPDDYKGDRTAGGRWRRTLSKHRVSLPHQKKILLEQLKIAAELGRPASVHGVQALGALFDIFKGLCESDEQFQREKSTKDKKRSNKKGSAKPPEQTIEALPESNDLPRKFPPRICLHSYSGTTSSLYCYFPNKASDSLPIKFYVSFSTPNNFRTALSQITSGGEIDSASARAIECMKFVPADRILVESDMHSVGREADDMLEDIVRRVCVAKDWELEEGVKILQANWRSFAIGDKT